MTNYEKYKSEIIEMLANSASIALRGGKIKTCLHGECSDCGFNKNNDCIAEKKKWLNAEAVSTLTADERKLCELLKCGYIAQDVNGEIFRFTVEPKRNSAGYWDAKEGVWINLGEIFAGITFEGVDSIKTKAWRVAELLELGVSE